MADTYTQEVPGTLEGWYVLHDVHTFDWAAWRTLDDNQRDEIAQEARAWAAEAKACPKGDSATYSVLTQKGDVMFVHYRPSPADLNRVELSLRQTRLFEFLLPAYSYLSVIEVGLYELSAIVRKRLADTGVDSGSDEYEGYFEREMARQKRRTSTRLFRDIPDHGHICFYPMSKRRGEQVNWYTLSMEDRREMMRGHGRVGHKYHDRVTQVVGGSVGLDDWEWGVSLHAHDPLVFKKLVYEMRFDPASALYAEFGPFFIGVRFDPAEWPAWLAGTLPPREPPAAAEDAEQTDSTEE